MKKILIIALVIIVGIVGKVLAQPRGNASPVVVGVNTITTYKNITFPYPTRDLVIENNDSADYVWVDTKSNTNQTDIGSCYLLGPGDSLLLYDFITNGISIIRDTTYSIGDTASPISVIAIY